MTSSSVIYHPYQYEVYEAIRNHNYRSVHIEKSRGVGISWTLGQTCALEACLSGVNIFYRNKDQESNREFYDSLEKKLYEIQANMHGKVRILNLGPEGGYVRSKDGKKVRISLYSSKHSKMRGSGYLNDLMIVDEAAFIPNVKETLDGVIGGQDARVTKLVICSTHNGVNNYFNTDVIKSPDTYGTTKTLTLPFKYCLENGMWERRLLEARVAPSILYGAKTIDEYVKRSYERMREKGADPDQELGCIPSSVQGLLFPDNILNPCLDRNLDLFHLEGKKIPLYQDVELQKYMVNSMLENEYCKLEKGEKVENKKVVDSIQELNRQYSGPWFIGYDPARAGSSGANTSSFALVKKNMEKTTPSFHAIFVETFDMPYLAQEHLANRLFELCSRWGGVDRMVIENNGIGMHIAENLQRSCGAIPSHSSKPKKTANIEKIRTLVQNRMLYIPDDSRIKSDFRHMEYSNTGNDIDSTGKQPSSLRFGKRHSDSVFSLGWALSEQDISYHQDNTDAIAEYYRNKQLNSNKYRV